MLKSGCRVEHLAFHTADRLQRAIAINSVIAWRIMLMTLLGRQVPDCDAGLMFTDDELSFRTENTIPTPETRSCGVATNGCQQQPWDIASPKNTASEIPLSSKR